MGVGGRGTDDIHVCSLNDVHDVIRLAGARHLVTCLGDGGLKDTPEDILSGRHLKLAERTSFAAFVWGVLDGKPRVNTFSSLKEVPAETEDSKRLSKALKKEGFRFVGSTTMYAFMQASGMVNDHLVSCPRHAPCAKLQRALRLPAS